MQNVSVDQAALDLPTISMARSRVNGSGIMLGPGVFLSSTISVIIAGFQGKAKMSFVLSKAFKQHLPTKISVLILL